MGCAGGINLAMKEIGGALKGLSDVGEHVGHVLVDGGHVLHVVDPNPIFGEDKEMDGLGSAVPAEVCEKCFVLFAIIKGCFLEGCFLKSCDAATCFVGDGVGGKSEVAKEWYCVMLA